MVHCSRVWYVMSDPFRYAKRIELNRDEVKYRFLVPEPQGPVEDSVISLDEMKRRHFGPLEFKRVEVRPFNTQAPSEFVIFESKSYGQPSRVFIKAPVKDAESDGGWWFEAEDHAAMKFCYRFDDLWNEDSQQID